MKLICYGDSNTWGCIGRWVNSTEPSERFDTDVRWPMVAQKELGDRFHIIEEGLGGRTTIYPKPGEEWKNGEPYLTPCAHTHRPLDLVVIMLGTNDTKDRFYASAACIGIGMARLVKKAQSTEC